MISRLISAAAIVAAAPAALAAEFSAVPAVVSDYDYRGITQTELDPAFQLGATLSTASGLYVAGWASTLGDDSFPDADFELDAFIGFAGGDPGKGVGYDVGLLAYIFPGNSDLNFEEIYAGISKGWFSGKLSYSDGFAGSDESAFYFDGNGTFPLPRDFSVLVHLGYSFGDYWEESTGEYYDFSVGVAKSFGNFDVTLKYVDGSDFEEADGTPDDIFTTEGRLWLSLATTLPWGR